MASTDPPPQAGDSIQAQVLLAIGEIKTTLAVMSERMAAIPDHEMRIRALERFRFTIAGMALVGGGIAGFIGYWVGHVVH